MSTVQDNTEYCKSKYKRFICDSMGNSAYVDVYDILLAFDVTCPAMQHAIKKLLAPGIRGSKDATTDKQEAILSIERSIAIDSQKEVIEQLKKDNL